MITLGIVAALLIVGKVSAYLCTRNNEHSYKQWFWKYAQLNLNDQNFDLGVQVWRSWTSPPRRFELQTLRLMFGSVEVTIYLFRFTELLRSRAHFQLGITGR